VPARGFHPTRRIRHPATHPSHRQAKQVLQDTSAQIATLHQQFEQVMGDVAAQLDALERSLQQFELTR
jgi:ABC-type transporter Mla subunit MlaD